MLDLALGDASRVSSSLVEPRFDSLAPSNVPKLSRSNLTIFKYYSKGIGPPIVNCPTHTDIGLVTVIPRATVVGGLEDTGGLHVFDWSHNGGAWVDVEPGLPEDCAIVFAGETLARMIQRPTPCSHQVAHIPHGAQRYSVPFQLLARSDALIAGKGSNLTAGQFVEEESARRISSVFPHD
jgi:isopenicillin N synthase-like dioxygenase